MDSKLDEYETKKKSYTTLPQIISTKRMLVSKIEAKMTVGVLKHVEMMKSERNGIESMPTLYTSSWCSKFS